MKLLALALVGLMALPAAAEAPYSPPVRMADGYIPPTPKKGHSYPPCYCTDSQGNRVEVGQMACLQIGSRQVMSRCEKARNLVIWRHQTEGCSPGV